MQDAFNSSELKIGFPIMGTLNGGCSCCIAFRGKGLGFITVGDIPELGVPFFERPD